ncbi:CRISPR-associated protein Csx18 [Vulcanococcus limneticus]|uniref:CRISPR-associated protein Csx18 n=1 Tax=Vulcanococcus limneticus TaxID=2170428 RepID=UPI00398BD20B
MASLPWRQRQFIRVVISVVNGGLSLVVLLIAPLGLAAVITLTLLISLSTYLCCAVGERLSLWLELTPLQGDDAGAGPVLAATTVDRAPTELRAARRRLRGS